MLLDMSLQSTTRRAWYEPFSSKHKQPPPSELKDWPNSEFEWHRLKQLEYGCNNNFADFPSVLFQSSLGVLVKALRRLRRVFYVQMSVVVHEVVQHILLHVLVLPDVADRPVAPNGLRHGLSPSRLLVVIVVQIHRILEQGDLLGPHPAPDDAIQRLRQVMVPALAVQALGDQDEGGPQILEIGLGGLAVDGVDALEPDEHERYSDEEVHGVEAVPEVV